MIYILPETLKTKIRRLPQIFTLFHAVKQVGEFKDGDIDLLLVPEVA